jgi:hypothetical protein
MPQASAITDHLLRSLAASPPRQTPYRHWLPADMLPAETCQAVLHLPFAAPDIDDTQGRRETHNSLRCFFSPENRAQFPVCDAVAESLRNPALVETFEQSCGIDLRGSFLRIEYCQDREGFWLEPHTDIGAKLLTLLIYLSVHPDAESWGTDIYDTEQRLVATLPGTFNSGLLFIPANDTWHGFHKRPITGIRRTLIVNFVIPEWRSRHELAYPEEPVA